MYIISYLVGFVHIFILLNIKDLRNLLHIIDSNLEESNTRDNAINPLSPGVQVLHPAEMIPTNDISSLEVIVDITGDNKFSHKLYWLVTVLIIPHLAYLYTGNIPLVIKALCTSFEIVLKKSQNYVNHFKSNTFADPYPTTILESEFFVFLKLRISSCHSFGQNLISTF